VQGRTVLTQRRPVLQLFEWHMVYHTFNGVAALKTMIILRFCKNLLSYKYLGPRWICFYKNSSPNTEADMRKYKQCTYNTKRHIPTNLNNKTKWIPPPQRYLIIPCQRLRRRHSRTRIIQFINTAGMCPHINGITSSRPLADIFRASGETDLRLRSCLIEIRL
jgi:hypothetical protein